MTTLGILIPVLVAGGSLGYTLFRSTARRLRRVPAVSLGRAVMATTLVRTRQRVR
jgi:hypothetical protein